MSDYLKELFIDQVKNLGKSDGASDIETIIIDFDPNTGAFNCKYTFDEYLT